MKDETNKWREAALALSKSNGESCARAEAAEARVAELEAVLKHEEHEKLTVSELDKSTITWLLERLIIATDLGDKRWKALNEIYEQAASGNTDWHWRHRKAGEGLGLKEEVEG